MTRSFTAAQSAPYNQGLSQSLFVTAIIAAGGRGQRFGGALPKQLLTIGGRTVLERSVAAFVSHPSVHELVVALPAELAGNPPSYLTAAEPGSKTIRIVSGGGRRQDSVANAFRVISDRTDVIVIHDAARPFASADLISRTIAAAAEGGAAVAAVQARDTVKRTDPAGADRPAEARRYVRETVPRETIYLAQTPQAFSRDVLRDALALGETGGDATDEASLAERAGHRVRIVDGEASNIKITTPEDLPMAEAIALRAGATLPSRTGRAGTGYDLHRLVEGRPLVLGGVTIPSNSGALGHSDADVICHALTDAILGAACLGDIGRHFPDSDPRWKGVSSLDLLQRAVALVTAQGLEVGNVDVTVILETPKIKDYVDAMRAAVATAIGVDVSRVSIKGKTNEGVDAVGRGEAIAAHAVALLR
jgi:2-C-methyl-D-erythritol 4-phosphate cytidylyltransferase/2-C-methyl-D-erythritol 2,4-cyclodiphosphate synthase